MAYPAYIQDILNSDPVNASVANKPHKQLERRTDDLKQRLDSVSAGQALILYDATVASSTSVGMPVFWNTSTQQFEAAYASVSRDSVTNEYALSASAHCVGVIYTKNSSTSADIILSGIASIPDIKDILGDGSGAFYLSNTAGGLTFDKTSLVIPVGQVLGNCSYCDDAYRVLVHPTCQDDRFLHLHYSADLTPTLVTSDTLSGWQEVTGADTDAPTGATFKYNLDADTNLKKLWPPIPIDAVSCTADWASATETVGGHDLTVNKTDSLVKINSSGIYWMSSSVVPYTATPNVSNNRKFRVTLHFSKIQYMNRFGVVTSLRPATNQPFSFVNYDGEESYAGDLYAKFTLKDQEVVDTSYDGKVLRGFTDEYKQSTTKAIHGIKSVDSSITVNSDVTFLSGTDTYNAGLVTLTGSAFPANYEVSPQIVKLGDANERELLGITYMGLPYNRNSSLGLKFEIPANYGTGISMKLRFMFLAPITGTYPELTIIAKRVARPSSTAISISGLTETTLTCATAVSVSASTVFEAETDEFEVTAGDVVIITVSRSSTGSPAYTSDAGIVRINGILNKE